MDLVHVCNEGVAVPPHALVADFADDGGEPREQGAVFVGVNLDGHLVLAVKVKSQLVPGVEILRLLAFLALKNASVHPLLVFVLGQFRIVGVRLLVGLSVIRDADGCVEPKELSKKVILGLGSKVMTSNLSTTHKSDFLNQNATSENRVLAMLMCS